MEFSIPRISTCSKVFSNEWTISTPSKPTHFKIIETPSFSPLSDTNVSFRFEAWYQQVDFNSERSVGLFKLKLVKLTNACISPKLEVEVDVKVYYSDGSLFVEYPFMPPMNVDKMSDVTFDDEISLRTDYRVSATEHLNKMTSNALIIKCKMIFEYENQASSTDEIKSNKYLELIKNLKSVYEPSVLSDFTFKVGDRSFPAHKVILAAHSPVFMKMMTQEFLESKTNTATITDVKPKNFDVFLKFLYSGEIGDKSWNSLKELYYLADKYDVGFLKTECTAGVISFLSIDLVCEILKLAYNYSDSDIKKAAISFAVNHIKELIVRDDWKELVETQPKIGYEVTVNFIPK